MTTNGEMRLLSAFLNEAVDQLDALDSQLLAFEETPFDAVVVGHLQRTLHTFKGSAGTAGFPHLANVSHEMEDLVQALRTGFVEPTTEVFDALFAAVDLLKSTLESIHKGGGDLEREPAEALVGSLKGLCGKSEPTAFGSDWPRLGEYEQIKAAHSTSRGGSLFIVEVKFKPETDLPEEIGIDLLRQCYALGSVITTLPPESQHEEVAHKKTFKALMGTELDPDEITKKLAHETIEGLGVTAYVMDPRPKKPGPDSRSSSVCTKDSIRVDLEKIDRMVELIGELVIFESMVSGLTKTAVGSNSRVRGYFDQLNKITRDLQDVGIRMRMVPVRGIFQRMSRLVRDIATHMGKRIHVRLQGEETEIDRSMVEKLSEPILHLVRNSVDHGIEPEEERKRKGKSAVGTITLSAQTQGSNIVIGIADDGYGIDRKKVLHQAKKAGFVSDSTHLTDTEILHLVFHSGLTTKEKVSELSGRGIGMDVVRSTIESLRGRIILRSDPGQGTSVKLVLPITLAIINGMLVLCGDERFIIPTLSVVEVVRPCQDQRFSLRGKLELLRIREELVPLLHLGSMMEVEESRLLDPSRGIVIVIEHLGRKLGLLVDDVISQQQVVIKSLGHVKGDPSFVSGGAILADGKVGLILSIDSLCESLLDLETQIRQAASCSYGSGRNTEKEDIHGYGDELPA